MHQHEKRLTCNEFQNLQIKFYQHTNFLQKSSFNLLRLTHINLLTNRQKANQNEPTATQPKQQKQQKNRNKQSSQQNQRKEYKQKGSNEVSNSYFKSNRHS